jgi:phage/plasmid-like protein (TIGR03299 family)
MSHELATTVDGRTAFAAEEGQHVWHALGQRLKPGASIEEWKTASGLDYELKRSPVFFRPEGSEALLQSDDHVALYRADKQELLSVMSDRYREVQPGQILDFFRRYTEAGGWRLTTAGALFGGRRYWAMAESGESFAFEGDRVFNKLFLGSSCDGTMATMAIPTTQSVVCNNTLQVLLNSAEAAQSQSPRKLFLSINHTGVFDPETVAMDLGALHGAFERFSSKIVELSQAELTKQEREVFASLVVDGKRVRAALLEQMENGPGQDLPTRRQGLTLWGAVSGVTAYFDHVSGREAERRFFEAQLGEGARAKQRAFTLATALLNCTDAAQRAEILSL